MNKVLILFSLIVLAKSFSENEITAQDFCDMSYLCKPDEDSIACAFINDISIRCDGTEVELDQDAIILQHNNYRQAIASGDYGPQYPTASHMTEIQWSDELALLASYNVRRCVFEHDQCRNTENFKIAGQNLGFYKSKGTTGPWDFENIARQSIDRWFNEYENGDESYITMYYISDVVVGHFTQMVKDSATHVGCASVFYNDGEWDTMLLACNYARTNIIGEATYVAGDPANECTKVSSMYSALCSVY